ncbi:hypothetical protein BO94DRAFT_352230 [Aspergillus sclerotioniger CBS 115572]|uniref:Uncharacterized protein n=1 Tax=Aspergillus sclerotioniger CBS 115572 TaxID=1450535 RepID=A0A317X638_9EURO|nr:hypothetical protein BO94DRAFT_352230 [Aspergillus sclerotioniger CBS 115572]PWY93775.1 hypothetical protein BO94DRAFT_352230 [Aspergillus sclerotioniger CBS 115572]
MSEFNGRRAPNFSQYLDDLNAIPSPYDQAIQQQQQESYNFDAELSLFTNTEFFDFDQLGDLNLPTFDAMEENTVKKETAQGINSDMDFLNLLGGELTHLSFEIVSWNPRNRAGWWRPIAAATAAPFYGSCAITPVMILCPCVFRTLSLASAWRILSFPITVRIPCLPEACTSGGCYTILSLRHQLLLPLRTSSARSLIGSLPAWDPSRLCAIAERAATLPLARMTPVALAIAPYHVTRASWEVAYTPASWHLSRIWARVDANDAVLYTPSTQLEAQPPCRPLIVTAGLQ